MRASTFEEVVVLSVPVGEAVLDVTWRRRLDRDPVCIDRSLIVLSRIPGTADVELSDASLYEAMTRLGAPPYRGDEQVEVLHARRRATR